MRLSYLDKITVGSTTYDVQDSAAVHFAAQTLTDPQKAQARDNIGAVMDGVLTESVLAVGWEQGTLKTTDGSNKNDSTRIRTNAGATSGSYTSLQNGGILEVTVAEGYEWSLRVYTTNSYTGFIRYTDWLSSGKEYINAGEWVRLVLRKTDDSDIDPTAAENIQVKIHSIGANAYGVDGATPTIAAVVGGRYICTTNPVTELAFTPSAYGLCSVRFVSGSTPTILTLPNTVKMPSWWTGPEANKTYEISILDGVYGVVTSWA